jgi:23S rRNA (guanosine2251-2'-O)-methyltransferase
VGQYLEVRMWQDGKPTGRGRKIESDGSFERKGRRGRPTTSNRGGDSDRDSSDGKKQYSGDKKRYGKEAGGDGTIWISGRNPVLESLRAGLKAKQLILRTGMGGRMTEVIRHEAERRAVPIKNRTGPELDRMLHHTDHRGVAMQLEPIKLRSLDAFLKDIPEKKRASLFFLVLDGLQDPQNLGAISRTAEAAGVDALILPSSARAPLSDASFRASAGALAWMPLLEVPFLEECLKKLGELGMTRIGLEERLGQPIHRAELERPLAVVVGGEGRGLSKSTIDELDVMLKIPMQGRIGSLNASVAAAVMVYQVLASEAEALDVPNVPDAPDAPAAPAAPDASHE